MMLVLRFKAPGIVVLVLTLDASRIMMLVLRLHASDIMILMVKLNVSAMMVLVQLIVLTAMILILVPTVLRIILRHLFVSDHCIPNSVPVNVLLQFHLIRRPLGQQCRSRRRISKDWIKSSARQGLEFASHDTVQSKTKVLEYGDSVRLAALRVLQRIDNGA